jgi:CreA protein
MVSGHRVDAEIIRGNEYRPFTGKLRAGSHFFIFPDAFNERNPMKKFLGLSALSFFAALGLMFLLSRAGAEQIGEVDTVFKFLGPDHKIVVEAHDDPKVNGVTCYVSRAKTGGIKGAVGLAEDLSEASIACHQVGPISFAKPLPLQEEVFSERISLVFKKIRIVRMVDKARNSLVYLTYADRVIEGSPQNSVATVAIDRSIKIPLK